MATKISTVLILGLTLLLAAGGRRQQQKPEDIPDAPSATRPIPPPSPQSAAGADEDNATPIPRPPKHPARE